MASGDHPNSRANLSLGGWKKGQSGNPGGRPKAIVKVEELAREHTTEAIETLGEIMRDKQAPSSSRVAAASALLDRGWGKPRAELVVDQTPDYSAMSDAQLDSTVKAELLRWITSDPDAESIIAEAELN